MEANGRPKPWIHGSLPARHPAAGHHTTPRPRERLHHRGVLRLRHLDMMREAINAATPAIDTPPTVPLTDDRLRALYSLR